MKLRVSKKTSSELSARINSLLVYQRMVGDRLQEKNYAKAREAMNWFNQAADDLIAVGVSVNKYGS